MLTLSLRPDDTSIQFEIQAGVAAELRQFWATADRLNVAHGHIYAQYADSHDRIQDIEKRLQLAENRPVAPANTRL